MQLDYPALSQYAGQLQRVLRPSCKQCIDYFEAVSAVRSLGKAVKQILKDDKDEVLYPALRRSYMAAVWVLQRSRLFAWQATQLNSNVLSTLFRLYLHHTNRAKGRAVSFHHISKCGGTTMCQLAASNRCSNPSMDQERNCVLDSRLDGPLWMVAHDVTQQGATPNATVGKLDDTAQPIPWANMTAAQRELARNFSVEPPLPMWLMYSCPYAPIGRPNTCFSRTQQVQDTRSTFLANERTLSQSSGATQVCHQFSNAIILRQPVPHVVSLLAEVKFRYVRQLAIWHNITSWQPPAWDISWWEKFGPALVGNYATRTLVGRESFCRSAANMSSADLAQAVNALMGFDMVMTLDRAKDIDLLQQQQQQQHPAAGSAAADEGDYSDDDDDDGESLTDEEFALAAAKMYAPHPAAGAGAPPPPPPPAVPKEVVEADAAVALVTRVWLERQVQLAGFPSIAAAGSQLPPRPEVTYMQQQDAHGALLVRVSLAPGANETRSNPQQEVWHAFPRHGFAFPAADMARLEQLTTLDSQLVATADLLLDLDTAWLQSLLHSHHYRKRMKSVATTYTACGFSGMMPLTDTVQDHVFQPEGLLQKSSGAWIS
ncbi:hypothetical protein OEZ85_008038 [Tetradesmus obliquus]|uniref:Uncharacterized protein n=1 Tax=Tetradesmus obliquus TaxID=3088 RepID=A0ABY8THP6_TETOB|nr:hypothetical protein OEZ85_008038 [Tetradesmus obliquus]